MKYLTILQIFLISPLKRYFYQLAKVVILVEVVNSNNLFCPLQNSFRFTKANTHKKKLMSYNFK